jgi:Lactonase, 7-bladed beta-propeller
LTASGALRPDEGRAQTPVPNSFGTEPAKVKAPANAADCHMHIYNPRFPEYSPGRANPHRNQIGPGPHPHFVSFDPSGRFLLAPDRGTDRLHIYRLDLSTGKLVPNNPAFAKTRPGAGPRHLAFHPSKPWAYVCDLDRHRLYVGF